MDNQDIKRIMILLLIALIIAVFVRFVIYSGGYFKINDESCYTAGLSQFSKNPSLNIGSSIISGLGYIVILTFFKIITGFNSLDAMNYFSILISSIYLLVLFGAFTIIFKDKKIAFLSSIAVLLTSYFIEPMLEGRPQQLGMLLFLFYFAFLYQFLKDDRNKYLYLCILIVFTAFIFHILSLLFLFFTSLIVLCFLYCGDKIRMSKIFLLLMPFILSLLYFLSATDIFGFNIFYATSGGIQWIFRVSSNPFFQYFGENFRRLAPLGILAISLLFPVFLSLLRYLYRKSYSLIEGVRFIIGNYRIPIAITSFLVALVFIFLQMHHLPFQVGIYRNTYLFLIMQSGNLLFGLIYMFGIVRLFGMKNPDDAIKYVGIVSFSLAVLTAITISFSGFMGWGQVNFGIRFLNYWTIFAAPIVVFELLNSRIRHFNKYLLMFFATFIIITSTLTASQAPQVLDIKNYWSYSTENALDWIRDSGDMGELYYLLPEKTFTMQGLISYYKSEYLLNNFKIISEKQNDRDLIYTNGIDYIYV